MALRDGLQEAPRRRGDALVTGERVPSTRDGMEALKSRGMGAIRIVWGPESPMIRYMRDEVPMPKRLRASADGYANSAFLLGLTNWLFAANVDLGPWLHVQTDSLHFAPVPLGTELTVEGAVFGFFERKGHEFVDVDVAAFFLDDRPVLSARLRAIYRLRGG